MGKRSRPSRDRAAAFDFGLGWLARISHFSTTTALPISRHRHDDHELIFCLKGELVYEIGRKPPVTLGAGMGIVIPRRTYHALKDKTDRPGERLGLHLAESVPPRASLGVFSREDYRRMLGLLMANACTGFRLTPLLVSHVRELAAYCRRGFGTLGPLELAHVRLLACTLLFHVSATLRTPPPNPDSKLMDEAVRFIDAHSSEPIQVADLVRFMGYSRRRFFELFKKHTGLTPNNYLTRLRIRKAKELLSASGKPAAEIAKAVGFSNAAYFCAVFRRYTGKTPARFRTSGWRRDAAGPV